MTTPHVPGSDDVDVVCPNDRELTLDRFDMGMRSMTCPCGSTHTVVMDVHPMSRWIPEAVEHILMECIEAVDEYDTFGTIHLMALVREEYPESVVTIDASEEPSVGFALLWLADMSPTELHRIIVELLVTLMDHAVGHTDDEALKETFREDIESFDVDAFVTAYRDAREFTDETDRPV